MEVERTDHPAVFGRRLGATISWGKGHDTRTWSLSSLEAMAATPISKPTTFTAWACRLGRRLGPSMAAFTRNGGLGWLSGVLRWRSWPLFFFFLSFFYSCTILCVYLTETALPNGSDYYFFLLGPRTTDVVVSTSTWASFAYFLSPTRFCFRGNGRERL